VERGLETELTGEVHYGGKGPYWSVFPCKKKEKKNKRRMRRRRRRRRRRRKGRRRRM